MPMNHGRETTEIVPPLGHLIAVVMAGLGKDNSHVLFVYRRSGLSSDQTLIA